MASARAISTPAGASLPLAATQTIIPASNNLNEIVCIGVTNASAGSLNWSDDVFDGTTSQKLVDTEPVAAHVRATFELPVRLTAAQYVRVTSAAPGSTPSRRTRPFRGAPNDAAHFT
jgi:hypothetical protein